MNNIIIKDMILRLLGAKKDYAVGLDIGTGAIKLVQFRKQEDGLHLVKTRVAELTNDKESTSALKELLSDINIKNSQFITLLNSHQTMVKKITTPNMPKDELREAISLEAKNYFPFSVDDCLIDFKIIGDVSEKGVRKLEVLVASCPNGIIKEHLKLLMSAGVRPSWIIHTSLAMYNLLRLRRFKEHGAVAALDMGKTFCELIIVKDNKLAFSRKLPICADDFTTVMTGTLVSDLGKAQILYEEAEKIKKAHGIPKEGSLELIDLKLTEGKVTAGQLIPLFRVLLEKLFREIASSFDFYREESHGGRVERLILFGGGAQLNGLDKLLSEDLGMEVEIYNLLEGIIIEQEAGKDIENNRIAIAVGAGIQKAGGINLLPSEIRQQTQKIMERATLKAVASAVIMCLILTFIGMHIQLKGLDKKIASAKLELSALKLQESQTKDWFLINKLLIEEPYWEDALKEISNVIPPNVYLKEMDMRGRLLTIRGVIIPLKNPEEILSGFIHQLEAGIFKNVRFVTVRDREGLKDFELQMEME